MGAAVLAAVAVWLVVPSTSRARARAVLGSGTPPRPVPLDTVGAGLVVIAATLLVGWPWGTLGAVIAAPWVRRSLAGLGSTAARRREARLRAQLPAALDLVAAALDAGRPPATAFALAGAAVAEPAAAELSGIAHRLDVGADPADVWSTISTGALAPVGRALRRAETTGMPAAEIVTTVAADLRRERRSLAARRSRSVGVATAAPLGLCFLPAFLCIGIVPMLIGLGRGLGL